MKFNFKRIYIFGGTGSGKTTLAKKMSSILKIPYYTTDDMVFKGEGYENKRSENERSKILIKTAKKKKWIIEGVHSGDWIMPAFKKADFVIILSHPRRVLLRRAMTRHIERRLAGDKRNSFRSLILLLKYACMYKNNNLVIHSGFVKKYKKKYVLLEGNKQIADFVRGIK